jgi:hypothetical protein
MEQNGTLSARQRRAIEALLTEPTTRAAAKAAGVGHTTIWRWLADPIFEAAYRSARDRMLESTLAMLQSASAESVTVLREVMTDKSAPPSARVASARAVLELTLRARETLEMESRLRALESAVGVPSAAGGRF